MSRGAGNVGRQSAQDVAQDLLDVLQEVLRADEGTCEALERARTARATLGPTQVTAHLTPAGDVLEYSAVRLSEGRGEGLAPVPCAGPVLRRASYGYVSLEDVLVVLARLDGAASRLEAAQAVLEENGWDVVPDVGGLALRETGSTVDAARVSVSPPTGGLTVLGTAACGVQDTLARARIA